MSALRSLRESTATCEMILDTDPTIETVVNLSGQQARLILNVVEKARGLVLTASAEVGAHEVVPQWWGALVNALLEAEA